MTSEEFLINRLNRISSVFPEIRIRYEHRAESQTNIIEVIPQSVFDNNLDYMKAEAELESEFEKLFPIEEIIFITENSLLEIKNVIRKFGYCQMSFDFSKVGFINITGGYSEYLNSGLDNFALAA
jgi:hypothetical protein